ncbi:uncharacterized protein LOC143466077 [Clavelina lepadiformis]|uniref:uncharacterized protein LOC143466077 n=1 Tax=Clavelina lepadiformis TaxID=159417 RepID=UPI0040433582
MSSSTSSMDGDEVTCPICLEMLKKPIRMLSCGHNLCQVCLESLCASFSSNLKCPTCRTSISLGPNGVESIPRNRTVENLIERLSLSNMPSGPSISVASAAQLTSQELLHMEGVALRDKNEKRYDDAIYMLQRIILSVENYYKVKYMIHLLECLLEKNALDVAEKVGMDMTVIVESEYFTSEAKEVCGKLQSTLFNQAKSFVEKNYKISILLIRCLFTFGTKLYDSEMRVNKLYDISIILTAIAKKIRHIQNFNEFHGQLPFMEKLVDEITKQNDCSFKHKAIKLAFTFLNFSSCCNATKLFNRAIEFSSQGIGNMKLMFGDSAKNYRVYGSLYHNLGVAYRDMNQLLDAQRAYLLAQEFKENATDWINNESKQNSKSGTNNALASVQTIG